MRTEFAWMCALNADHYNYKSIPNKQYDLGIIIIPKKNPNFDINTLKNCCNKIAVMQEGPNWYWQDYPLNQQIWYFNTIQEADFMFVHNESDKKYYEGLTSKECKILPSLMIEDSIKNKINDEVDKSFRPEFLNRIDEIVVFNQLTTKEIEKIAKIEINNFIDRLKEIDYDVKIDSKVLKFISVKGFDKEFGARPIKRAIQKYIEDEIAKRIVKNEIKKGDIISITHNKGEDFLIFNV